MGKSFTPLEDGSLRIDQEFYTTARVQEIHLSRDRKRQRYSVCSPVEIEQLRALLGVLSWIAKETRADIAGKVALIQQALPRPMIKDVIAANNIAKELLQEPELGIKVMPIPMTTRLRAGVITDASWGNAREFGTYLEEGTVDWWEETPTQWIRHHYGARMTAFHPAAAPHGPDMHQIISQRQTELQQDGKTMVIDDDWTTSSCMKSLSTTPWKGKTTFWKQKDEELLHHKQIHSGYEQLLKLYSQGGEITFFYDEALPSSQEPQNVTLASWKSYRLKRRTVNTLSSETQALVRGLGSVHWYRVLILEAKGHTMSARQWQDEVAKVPFICITDSKSLYDAVKKDTNPTTQCEDKRTSIDISLVKQELSDLQGQFRWVGGRTMPSDCLTKEGKSDYLRHIMRQGRWSILEEGASLQRKLAERQGSNVYFLFSFDQQKVWSVQSSG